MVIESCNGNSFDQLIDWCILYWKLKRMKKYPNLCASEKWHPIGSEWLNMGCESWIVCSFKMEEWSWRRQSVANYMWTIAFCWTTSPAFLWYDASFEHFSAEHWSKTQDLEDRGSFLENGSVLARAERSVRSRSELRWWKFFKKPVNGYYLPQIWESALQSICFRQ
jgi:hypothetical protein